MDETFILVITLLKWECKKWSWIILYIISKTNLLTNFFQKFYKPNIALKWRSRNTKIHFCHERWFDGALIWYKNTHGNRVWVPLMYVHLGHLYFSRLKMFLHSVNSAYFYIKTISFREILHDQWRNLFKFDIS